MNVPRKKKRKESGNEDYSVKNDAVRGAQRRFLFSKFFFQLYFFFLLSHSLLVFTSFVYFHDRQQQLKNDILSTQSIRIAKESGEKIEFQPLLRALSTNTNPLRRYTFAQIIKNIHYQFNMLQSTVNYEFFKVQAKKKRRGNFCTPCTCMGGGEVYTDFQKRCFWKLLWQYEKFNIDSQ